jgi:hypothetical protein
MVHLMILLMELLVLPLYCPKLNGSQCLLSQLDYQQVISILGRINNDQDSVVLQFPLRVKTSNYTEVTANNQTEYNYPECM